MLWQARTGFISGRAALDASAGGGGGLGLQTSLASFFSLDNTLSDSVGAVTDLTNNNVVTFVTPPGSGLAAVAKCANFVSASSQYLSHTNSTGINVVGGDFSIQLWFYATTNTTTLISKNTGGFGSREFAMSYTFGTGSSNPVQGIIGDNSPLNTGNFSTSAWHHAVLTFNATSKATVLYIDGSSAATATGSGSTGGTSTLYVGANATPGVFMSGNIALVGIWKSRILSSGDVTALYNSGSGLSYAAMA